LCAREDARAGRVPATKHAQGKPAATRLRRALPHAFTPAWGAGADHGVGELQGAGGAAGGAGSLSNNDARSSIRLGSQLPKPQRSDEQSESLQHESPV
jgi:hypothetical protein